MNETNANLNNLEPMQVKYGTSAGIYDPKTDLVKLTVHGEAMTLAVDAVMDNPQLVADFPPEAAYILGWLNAHIAHQRQVFAWLASGVLQVSETLQNKH